MPETNTAEIKPRYDAVIIGSGLGGATLALRLGQAGRKVLVIERGDFLKPQRQDASAPVGRYLYHMAPDRDAQLSYVGGQTKFYGSALYRLRESDFCAVEHESGTSPAWPIAYATLQPYYAQAETLFRVHGAPEGDASEPPRTTSFPYPPIPREPIVAKLAQRLAQSGAGVWPSPAASTTGPADPASCVPRATRITASSTPRWTRKPPPSARRWPPATSSWPP